MRASSTSIATTRRHTRARSSTRTRRLSRSPTCRAAAVPLPRLPDGDLTSVAFSRSERLMAFYLTGDRSPTNLHVLDLRTGKVTRLTDTLSKDIDPQDLVDAQVVRFKSFDAVEIPNVLLKPHQAADAKAPALVWVHGGPGG